VKNEAENMEKARIDRLIDTIIRLAQGDYTISCEISENNDEIDALAMGINMLIDDIKMSNEALQESEEKYRNLVERANDGIVIIQDGKIAFANHMIAKMLGYEIGDMINKDFTLFVADSQKELLFEKHQRRVAGKEVPPIYESDLKTKDNSIFPIEVNAGVIKYNGEPAEMAFIRDITQRVQAEQALQEAHNELVTKAAQLAEANAELSQHAYVVSHDLKAPLRAIHNYADFLGEDLEDTLDEEQKEYLDGLRRAVRQGEELTNDLLEFSRIDRRGKPMKPVDMGVFLQKLIASLNLPPEVEIVMRDDWPTIDTEPTLLRQIFQNIIENAVKFNDSPDKRVEIGWLLLGEECCEVFVRDNGIGIEPRHQEQIFHVFQRLHTSDEYDGTGIGLAIVRKAISKLHASVRVESKPGEGSTFFVALPKTQEES